MCQGLTHSYHGLLGIRFLMGIVETGLPAGAGLLIASYYRKKELSLRFALFFAFGQSGSCFSGVSIYIESLVRRCGRTDMPPPVARIRPDGPGRGGWPGRMELVSQ
jgi:MFS family permease